MDFAALDYAESMCTDSELGMPIWKSGGADPPKNVIFVSRAVFIVKKGVFGHLKMLAKNVRTFLRVLMLTFSANIFK